MALPGIMPFESNGGQGAERAKPPCCGRRDPTAGGNGLRAPQPIVDLLLRLVLPYPYRAWILPSSCSRFLLT